MISIITFINFKEDFEVLKRNLVSLEPDWGIGVDLLCIVTNKNLFLECRDFLLKNVDRGECLVEYNERATLKSGVEYLNNKNDYVLLLRPGFLIPDGGVAKLYKSFLEKPQAGFIAGRCINLPTAHWTSNIYGKPEEFFYWRPGFDEGGLVEVDMDAIQCVLTKADLYREIYCSEDLEDYQGYSYGIKLRRQGYQNYVDTKVLYSHGGKR